MLNKKIDTEEIERKNKVVDHAISVLKTEFIGIDKQIVHVLCDRQGVRDQCTGAVH